VGLQSTLKNGQTRAFKIGGFLFALLIGAAALALPALQITGFYDFKPYAQTWKWVLVLAGMLLWMLLLLFSISVPGHKKKIILFAIAPVFFIFSSHFIIPKRVVDHKAPGAFLLQHSHRIRPNTILVSGEAVVLAVCWVYKRNDVYVVENAGELSYGFQYEDSKHRLLDLNQFRELILKNRGTGRVTLIAKGKKYKKWKHKLPEPFFKESNGDDGFVLAQF